MLIVVSLDRDLTRTALNECWCETGVARFTCSKIRLRKKRTLELECFDGPDRVESARWRGPLSDFLPNNKGIRYVSVHRYSRPKSTLEQR